MKKIVYFLFTLVIMLLNIDSVYASYTINWSGNNTTQITESKVGVSPAILSSYLHTYYRITTDNDIVYCYDANSPYRTGVTTTYSNCSTVTSNTTELAYIFENGYGGSNSYSTGSILEDYFITQLAAWKFANPYTLMNGFQYNTSDGSYTGNYCDNNGNCSSNEITLKVAQLVNDAMSYSGSNGSGSVSLSSSSKTMTATSDGNYYISGPISIGGSNLSGRVRVSVSGVSGAFVTTSTSATSGSTSFSRGSTVYVKVPTSNLSGSFTITLSASATTNPSDGTITRCSYNSNNQSIMGYTPGTSRSVSDSLTLTGSVSATIKISKKDITNNKELAGATLVIKNSSGTIVKTITSSTSSQSFSIDPGTYTLEETKAPDGYIKSTEKITFVVSSDGTITVNGSKVSTVTMTNKPIMVKFSKKSITGTSELAGATLKVTDTSGNTITDVDGTKLEWTSTTSSREFHLKAGTYKLVEVTAPKGYAKSSESITFTVNSDGTVSVNSSNVDVVTMTNKPIYVTVSKQSISGTSELAGASLKITSSTDSSLTKDLDGNSLSWTSGSTSKKFHLPAGKYTLTEVSAPNGYVAATSSIEFIILEDGTVMVGTSKVDTVVMKNRPTSIEISKQSITSTSELAGAKLKIVSLTDSSLTKDLDGNSLSWTSTTTPKKLHLPAGKYKLIEESAPRGYIKNTKEIEFIVGSDGSITIDGSVVGSVVMKNTPIIVTISKQSVTNSDELPGAHLKIIDKNGNIVKDINNKDLSWISTNTPYQIHIASGTYYLVEEIAPNGYVKSSETIEFTVDENGNVTVDGKKVDKVIMKNKEVLVVISKRSITGDKELPGAHLKVVDENNKVVTDLDGKELSWISTDSLAVFRLGEGTYYLIEEIAPDGYIKSKEKIKFTIDKDGKILVDNKEVTTIIMKNDPIIVNISKKSINGKTELSGATLRITDKSGNVITDLQGEKMEWVSGTKMKSFHLKAGEYILEEVKAPNGYELSDLRIEFKVLEDGTVSVNKEIVKDNTIVFTNTPEPKQTQTGSFMLYIIFIGILSVGGVTYYVTKKNII